ncbi:HpcH/HpaI aldolase/citrate lyase family protein, partial [bacterium]|nr:HpcH/HpaI aldolase/citrate lyase family protein [candidate division CSSED10-310 bacterium]
EDYATDIGATRTKEGIEIAYARSRIVNAAAAAGIEAIDTPFVDVEDIDGLKKDSITARNMGFKGKALISPKHCMIVKNVFTPSPEEVENALRIIAATKQAKQQGKGAIRVDGKMIDAPIVKRALDILKKANIDGDFYE